MVVPLVQLYQLDQYPRESGTFSGIILQASSPLYFLNLVGTRLRFSFRGRVASCRGVIDERIRELV